MPRVKGNPNTRRRRKKVLDRAEGFRGRSHKVFKKAYEAVTHALKYAYVGRKLKKRDFRRLWIQRMNAALRNRGLTYSKFMHSVSAQSISLSRKTLADLAVNDPRAFDAVVAATK